MVGTPKIQPITYPIVMSSAFPDAIRGPVSPRAPKPEETLRIVEFSGLDGAAVLVDLLETGNIIWPTRKKVISRSAFAIARSDKLLNRVESMGTRALRTAIGLRAARHHLLTNQNSIRWRYHDVEIAIRDFIVRGFPL